MSRKKIVFNLCSLTIVIGLLIYFLMLNDSASDLQQVLLPQTSLNTENHKRVLESVQSNEVLRPKENSTQAENFQTSEDDEYITIIKKNIRSKNKKVIQS